MCVYVVQIKYRVSGGAICMVVAYLPCELGRRDHHSIEGSTAPKSGDEEPRPRDSTACHTECGHWRHPRLLPSSSLVDCDWSR